MKAAMMFDMLDDDDSGYIELEELIDAVRRIQKFHQKALGYKNRPIFSILRQRYTWVPRSIFKAMVTHARSC